MFDLKMPEIEVDVDKRFLMVNKKRCHLPQAALKIFAYLIKHRGMYRSSAHITAAIWGDNSCDRAQDIGEHIYRIRNVVGSGCVSSRYGYGWIYDKQCLLNPLAKVGGKDVSGIVILPEAGRLFRHDVEAEKEKGFDEVLEELVVYPISFPILYHLMCNAGSTVPARELGSVVWPHKENWQDCLGEAIRNIRKTIEVDWRDPRLLLAVGEYPRELEGYHFVGDDAEAQARLGELKLYLPKQKG